MLATIEPAAPPRRAGSRRAASAANSLSAGLDRTYAQRYIRIYECIDETSEADAGRRLRGAAPMPRSPVRPDAPTDRRRALEGAPERLAADRALLVVAAGDLASFAYPRQRRIADPGEAGP